MDIAARLNELMKRAGVSSAKKLSELSGVSQTMISKILRSASMPTTGTLELLCNAMNVTMEEFFSPNDPKDKFMLRAQMEDVEPSEILVALLNETDELTEAQLWDIVEYARYIKKKGR